MAVTAAASTTKTTHRHKSGHAIVKHRDHWDVMSRDGAQVLRKATTLEEAVEWCDTRFATASAGCVAVKVRQELADRLAAAPEAGMGYQRVDVTLADGTVIKDVPALNGEVVLLSEQAEVADLALRANAVGGKSARHLHLAGVTGEIRTAKFEDKDHTVIPVVALIGDVTIWPVNAPHPEFVPADVLATAPQGWNGRPCVCGHPEQDGHQVSANSPHVLETSAFGRIFNSEYRHRKLSLEAWLDPTRADAVGPDAQRVIERALAGEPVEVSVGCYVVSELRKGVDANGRAYEAVWTEIIPDHLALLKEGDTGACSVEMGCGAPRVATVHTLSANGESFDVVPRFKDMKMQVTLDSDALARAVVKRLQEASVMPDAKTPLPKRSLRERLFESLSTIFRGQQEGVSDAELRGKLYDAARAVEPGFLWVEDVYPADGLFVYCVQPEDAMQTIRRPFTIDDSTHEVALGDPREVVERVTSYQPVAAAATPPAATATSTSTSASAHATSACGCGGSQKKEPVSSATATQETAMHKHAERIRSLIENTKTAWTPADQAFLEGLDDDRLKTFETQAEPPAPAAVVSAPAAAAPVAEPVAAKQKTEAEWLADAPPALRDLVSDAKARSAHRKTQLVASLTVAQEAYTKPELEVMEIAQLEKLALVANAAAPAVDYSGVGLPRAAGASETDYITNPPNGWEIGLAALKAKNAAAEGKAS